MPLYSNMVKPVSQNQKRELVKGLVQGIRQDIESYSQLKGLLHRQRELMQQRDNQGLNEHNQLQSRLCHSLMEKANDRAQTLQQLGFAGNASGMMALVARLPKTSSEQVAKLWNHLLALVIESKQINESNGKLLVAQQEVITQILNRNNEQAIDYGDLR